MVAFPESRVRLISLDVIARANGHVARSLEQTREHWTIERRPGTTFSAMPPPLPDHSFVWNDGTVVHRPPGGRHGFWCQPRGIPETATPVELAERMALQFDNLHILVRGVVSDSRGDPKLRQPAHFWTEVWTRYLRSSFQQFTFREFMETVGLLQGAIAGWEETIRPRFTPYSTPPELSAKPSPAQPSPAIPAVLSTDPRVRLMALLEEANGLQLTDPKNWQARWNHLEKGLRGSFRTGWVKLHYALKHLSKEQTQTALTYFRSWGIPPRKYYRHLRRFKWGLPRRIPPKFPEDQDKD